MSATLTGFMLSVGVALVQFWPGSDWLHLGLTVGVFLVGQFLEGNIISPSSSAIRWACTRSG